MSDGAQTQSKINLTPVSEKDIPFTIFLLSHRLVLALMSSTVSQHLLTFPLKRADFQQAMN